MNRAADLAIGGWQVTAITTFQKGFPYSILANDNFGLLTTFTQRANLVPGCNPNSGVPKSINEFFNTACFTQPLAGQFGNSGRDILRGPGINNWDMGIGKDFNFTERVAFQFRAEAFNVFNHAQYGYDPNTGYLHRMRRWTTTPTTQRTARCWPPALAASSSSGAR